MQCMSIIQQHIMYSSYLRLTTKKAWTTGKALQTKHYVTTSWYLVISTGICTKVETKRVHIGFPCCIPSVDLRHYNHHGLELNSETSRNKKSSYLLDRT